MAGSRSGRFSCSNSFHIVVQDRCIERVVFPFRMLRRHRLHAIERECKLEIEWLLAPQRSVVIEDRDSIFGFNKVRAAGRSYAEHKIKDALFRGTFVPGKKWIAASHIGAPRDKGCEPCTRITLPSRRAAGPLAKLQGLKLSIRHLPGRPKADAILKGLKSRAFRRPSIRSRM